MPQNNVQKGERQHYHKQNQQYFFTPEQSQSITTKEWIIPRLDTPSQLFAFALLTSAALIALSLDLVKAEKAKAKEPVWQKEVPPAVARRTAIASTAIIAPIRIDTFQPSSYELKMPESQAPIRSDSKQRSIEIIKIIQNRTSRDNILDMEDPVVQEQLQDIMNIIFYAEASLAKNNHIIKVLSQQNFMIALTTQEKFIEAYPQVKEGIMYANFARIDKQKSRIALPIDAKLLRDHEISAVRHEFWHARHHQLHQYKPCQVAPSLTTTPIFPITPENIQRYNEALDKGDERIKEFMKLRWELFKGTKLSLKQDRLLSTYVEASRGTLLSPLCHEAEEGLINQLIQQYPAHTDQDFSITAKVEWLGLIKIIGISNNKYKPMVYIQPTNEQIMLILLPDHIQYMLNDPIYSSQYAGIKLAERDAYLRQSISEKAFQTFYPEAYQMQQDYEAYCDPSYRISSP